MPKTPVRGVRLGTVRGVSPPRGFWKEKWQRSPSNAQTKSRLLQTKPCEQEEWREEKRKVSGGDVKRSAVRSPATEPRGEGKQWGAGGRERGPVRAALLFRSRREPRARAPYLPPAAPRTPAARAAARQQLPGRPAGASGAPRGAAPCPRSPPRLAPPGTRPAAGLGPGWEAAVRKPGRPAGSGEGAAEREHGTADPARPRLVALTWPSPGRAGGSGRRPGRGRCSSSRRLHWSLRSARGRSGGAAREGKVEADPALPSSGHRSCSSCFRPPAQLLPGAQRTGAASQESAPRGRAGPAGRCALATERRVRTGFEYKASQVEPRGLQETSRHQTRVPTSRVTSLVAPLG